jgi:hypothetical protein
MADLPNHILVQAKMHNRIEGDPITRYILFQANHQEDGLWRLDAVRSPQNILSSGQWHTNGIEGIEGTYKHYRDTSIADDPKIFETRMKQTNRYIVVSGIGTIYVYTVTRPNTVLSKHYYYVCFGKDDVKKEWHLCVNHTESVKLPEHVSYRIPVHIVRHYIDSAIRNKEDCPITMDPLTKENTVCTPCGHLFNKDALYKAVEVTKKCPTCRSEIMLDEIQN